MYQKLWNFTQKHTRNTHTASLFLFILIAGWSIAGLAVGTLLCQITAMTLPVQLTILLCTTGYAGLIPGFFAGIFFLYKLNLKRPAGLKYHSDSEERTIKLL